ncbi:MAG: ankyrin repeat domain-containing protein [Rickettsiales bacterium]|nr:ankyrin repeat domain-containing protein [Rickettsiales bacterium]
MRNLIIILYFIFLFRLAIAESVPSLPGLENEPAGESAFGGVPSANSDDEFTFKEFPEQEYKKSKNWVNPDKNVNLSQNQAPQITPPSLDNFANEVAEEELPTIRLPQNNAQATKLPDSKIRQGKILDDRISNEETQIADPFEKIEPDFNFDELEANSKAQANKQKPETLIKNNTPQQDFNLGEQFPETPELDFSGKRKEIAKTKELSPEEREKQVDELLNSVIGENKKEEQINPEDLLENTGAENQNQETEQQVQQPVAQDFDNVRRRVGYSSLSFSEQQLSDQLVRAAMIGDKNSVTALLHSGRSANATNKFGETPLMGAIFNAHNDIVEILLAEGANPNSVDAKGNTPLHVAVASRNFVATQQLLRAGAKVDFRNNSNDTPLLIATLNNSLDLIDVLVREGADVNKSNGDGLTPLHIATYNNNIEIVKYLLYVGANANMVTRDGLKPYDLAYGKNFDIARLLASYTGRERFFSNDIQNIIKQRNAPIYSPQSNVQTADQFSMFPQSYVEAETKAEEQSQNLSLTQTDWWAANQTPAEKMVDNSDYNKTSTINANNLAQEINQQNPASLAFKQISEGQNNAPQQAPASQQNNFSNEIYLDSNQINQTPTQVPASIRMRNYQGSSLSSNLQKIERLGGSLDTKQARTILLGGTLKYSDMTPEQQNKWDTRLEKWIRKAGNLTAINQEIIEKYKRQGKILQSIYREQFGMNIEKIRQKMASAQ